MAVRIKARPSSESSLDGKIPTLDQDYVISEKGECIFTDEDEDDDMLSDVGWSG